jgi:pimeloyl-ACP methyl ester carboxylesterase
MQVPYLARHFTVVCFDGRGSGGSGRPADASAYSDAAFALDALTVMDAAGIGSAVLVSVSRGALWALRLCAEHPDRVLGSVFIAPTAPLMPPLAERRVQRFGEVIDDPVGWQTYNAHYWKTHYPEFVTFFAGASSPSRTRRNRSRTRPDGRWRPMARRCGGGPRP